LGGGTSLSDSTGAISTPVRNRKHIPDIDEAGPGQPTEDDVGRIGAVHVEDAEWRRPELGYWLVPEVHGRGYGK